MLYKRIKVHARKSPRLQIQKMYKDVFDAIEECGIDDMGYNALEDLLIPIHFLTQSSLKITMINLRKPAKFRIRIPFYGYSWLIARLG